MLRTILSHHQPEGEHRTIDRNLLVQYFSEAFSFSDGQAYPLFGWLPNGQGELEDSDIDHLLSRRIHQTRHQWEPS
jgi:hypothetical protein